LAISFKEDVVKRSANVALLILVCLAATTTASGQKGCGLNIVGTWKAINSNEADSVLYRFGPDATVAVLSRSGLNQSSEMREIATATYTLDNPKAPKVILLKATREAGGFSKGTSSMDITGYDDTSLTIVKSGSGSTRWVRVDPYRYFIVLAGRTGVFYDRSGPTFPILIKMDGGKTQIDAVGIYSLGGRWAFGSVPAETYNEFMKEPRSDSDVMLRLEITAAQYERGLKIVRTWERRVREGDLLYPDLFLDNILLVKQITESLNDCGEKFRLYKLDWSMNDRISNITADNPASRAPFMYFKELRRLNESLHVPDEQFYESNRSGQPVER
jgi:hypothetical protein